MIHLLCGSWLRYYSERRSSAGRGKRILQPEPVNPVPENGECKVDVESLKLRQKDCTEKFFQARGSGGFSQGKSAGYEKEKVQPVLVIRSFHICSFTC